MTRREALVRRLEASADAHDRPSVELTRRDVEDVLRLLHAPVTQPTRREIALCAVIEELLIHVEELGCTCATHEQRVKFHINKSRRRKDSACTGVALAVTADLRRRRALRLKEPER